jgi:hypothetical protein
MYSNEKKWGEKMEHEHEMELLKKREAQIMATSKEMAIHISITDKLIKIQELINEVAKEGIMIPFSENQELFDAGMITTNNGLDIIEKALNNRGEKIDFD